MLRPGQANASKPDRDCQTAPEAESDEQDATDVPRNLCHHERGSVDQEVEHRRGASHSNRTIKMISTASAAREVCTNRDMVPA
jgi:hypothetical protein